MSFLLYVDNDLDYFSKVVNCIYIYIYLDPITQIRLPLSALTFQCLSSVNLFKKREKSMNVTKF